MLAEAADWQRRDLGVLWHPCTQMREHPTQMPLLPIVRGEGAWLVGRDGRRYLDAISSWWTNLFGHGEPAIAEAIATQARTLEHVIFAGFSHAPAVQLAEGLLACAPRQAGRAPLSRVFYADNGSAGIEVALKMSFHAHRNAGDMTRTRFAALHNGYHGETLGALSVGDVPLYRSTYAPLLNEPLFVPSPDAFDALPGESAEACAHRAADALDAALAEHGASLAALVVEPLVQCAGGMRMHHPAYLARARAACDRHGLHLIADEIAVGFGRTGTLFACEQAGIAPDLLCLSKGLTGGFLPLAAVLATEAIYAAFLDDRYERAFLHSHSYSGNPIACAAGCAVLAHFQRRDVLGENRRLAARLRERAEPLARREGVLELRQTGMILAFELDPAGGRARARSLAAYRAALDHGVLLRPLGNVLYWMPPYCLPDAAIEPLAEATAAAIEAFLCA
jgi:adenosylmethionine-8-amino-7-oxononanoate aminotransferase